MSIEKREPIEIKMDLMEFLFNYRTQKVSRIMHVASDMTFVKNT